MICDKRFKNAINFMLFTYFSFTIDDLNNPEKVLEKIIDRAYLDASKRVLTINGSDPRKKENGPDYVIKNGIEELRSSNKKCFDKWHKNLCKVVIKEYQYAESNFSLGNAQKWVNMTLKYLMITVDISRNVDCGKNKFVDEYGKVVDDFKRFFHVPIDRYILKAASSGKRCRFAKAEKTKKYWLGIKAPTEENEWGFYSEDNTNNKKTMPWSHYKIEQYEERYLEYQRRIKKQTKEMKYSDPIDWEVVAWIAQAKCEKK